MKKVIFIALAVVLFNSASSQVVASLTFQAQDWAWLIGKNVNSIHVDSASATEFRKIRDQIRAINPASYTVNVTVNNVPEWVTMAFYRTVKTGNAGEIVSRYTAITTQIEGKAQLAAQIQSFNARLTEDFEATRDIGRTIVMDN
jgi:PKD repeat protein